MIGISTCSGCGTLYVGPACPKCTSGPTLEKTGLDPGQSIHGFEILESIGKGGMGLVYRARQTSLGRTVALKLLPREMATNPEFGARFEREAKAMASLTHPNIVGCYDFGREGEFLFLAMEFVDGFTLREILTGRKLSMPESVRLMIQLCEALEYAHGLGVVHRDLKPENILIDKATRVKVADFGLVKRVGPAAASGVTLTATGATLGTTRYMAPEQALNPHGVDHRADLYSAGVIFYELLTGRVPVGEVEPPSRSIPLHPLVDQIALRALARDPADRYPSAEEFRRDLQRLPN